MKSTTLTSIAIILSLVVCHTATAQTGTSGTNATTPAQDYSALKSESADPPPPPTTKERVERLQTQYSAAVSDLVVELNKVPATPSLISSDELISAVDKADKQLTRLIAASIAIRSTLKDFSKTIDTGTTFTDEEKSDLQASAESMAKSCAAVAKNARSGVEHLKSVYKAMSEWRKVYKTYLNIQGKDKATEKLKTMVEGFVKPLQAHPSADNA